MTHSEQTDKIYDALFLIQNSGISIATNTDVEVLSARGEHYVFSFADLKSVKTQLEPVLKEHGLLIHQSVGMDCAVTTTLYHKESKQWISDTASLPLSKDLSVQAYGQAITYLRRYSILTILGLTVDTDDDANKASGNKASFKKDGKPLLTYETMKHMTEELEKGNYKDVEKAIQKYELSDSQKASLTSLINTTKAEKTKQALK